MYAIRSYYERQRRRVILDETCSGALPEQVAAIPRDIIYRLFGRELSMGKSMGLMGIIDMVKKP